MTRHLVLVGGGHAHLTTLKNLDQFTKLGHRVTLISPSPYHYYSGMGPGLLSGIYHPREVRFNVEKMSRDRGAGFLKGKVVRIDLSSRRLIFSSGDEVRYDVASFNTGSEVSTEPFVSGPVENLFPIKPIINLLRARHLLLEMLKSKAAKCVVIGGGPGGLEVTANLCRLVREARGKAEIAMVAGRRLLAEFPEKVRRLALRSLTSRGVEIVENNHVQAIEAGKITLRDGKTLPFDVAFVAAGISPSPLFRNSGLATGKDGGLLVNSCLQSVSSPAIFGGGDCISLQGYSLAKVGVYAVRQNPILYYNLLASLRGREMRSFRPQKDFLLVFNMGNGRGIFCKNKWGWEQRCAFWLKDYIDRRFMRKYQVSGELQEKDKLDE
jgi:NADH dehydrogenase FAD-containing subunit